MVDEALVREAEARLADAALAWVGAPGPETESALRSAAYMVRKARAITGKVRVAEVRRELEQFQQALPRFPPLFVVLNGGGAVVTAVAELTSALRQLGLGRRGAEYRAIRQI